MNMTVSADTLSVTCSGWTANDQTCTFEVRTLTQDCGFISDAATNSIILSSEYCIWGMGDKSRCMHVQLLFLSLSLVL